MKFYSFYFFVILLSSIVYGQQTEYVLVWGDEFEGNGVINSEKWHHQTLLPNGDSWYNGEIQHYTNRQENSYVSDGTLKIVAKRGFFIDQGVSKEFTSARLNSKFAFTYGKVEVRAKLPFGVGTWPAIWTLGQNITEPGGYWADSNGTTSWPACGEIDIMEHWGDNQDFVQSATHTPSSFGNTINKGGQNIPNASNEFHTYTMEWTPENITFSVDNLVHYIYEPPTQNEATWPFTDNQYILLNVAILPNITTSFTQSSLEIDYVRVYQEQILNVADDNLSTIKIFPNPTKNIINIKSTQSLLGAELGVYSVLGQKLMANTIVDVNSKIDVSILPKGTYFVKIKNESQTFTKVFIKE